MSNNICRKGLEVAAHIPHVVFTMFLMMWLDQAIDWDFFIVFIPAWFEMLVLFVSFGIAVKSWASMNPSQRGPFSDILGMIVVGIPLFVFALFFVLKLQGEVTWAYVYVGIPAYVLGLLALILVVAKRTHMLLNIAVVAVPASVFVLLAALRLDGVLTCDWAVVFVPLWVLFAAFLMLACCAGCLEALSLPQKQRLPVFARASGTQSIVALLAVGLVLVFAVFVSLRLDGITQWKWYVSVL
jgi:hypothetical protein